MPSLRRYWRLLARYLHSQTPRVLLLSAALAASITLQLLTPQLLRAFLDQALAQATLESLLTLGLLYFVAAFAHQGAALAALYWGESVSWSATNALREELTAHCLRLDLAFHAAHSPGEMVERIDGDVTLLAQAFAYLIIDIFGNLALVVGVLVMLWQLEWRAGLGLSLFACVALALMVRIRGLAVPHWARVRAQSAQFFGFIAELLDGAEDVRANGAVAHVMRRFEDGLRTWFPLQRRAWEASSMLWISTVVLFACGYALAFLLGAWLWSEGVLTLGAVYLLIAYTELLRHPLETIRAQLEELQKAEAGVMRIDELLRLTPRLHDGTAALPRGPLSVTFDHVYFAYAADQPPVLNDFTFTLAPGRVLAVLGRSGAGKSTLARLLVRFFDPQSGAIRVGDIALHDAALASVRGRIGIVTQDVQVFKGTVRDNLTFFDPQVSNGFLWGVLNELGLDRWLARLPHGLDTVLEGAGSLSSGEAQLLALARVFLKDPGLVILDEPAARIDPATERLVTDALRHLLIGRTVILITHRLRALADVDDVLVLEDNRVSEYGARLRLLREPSSRLTALLQAGLTEEDALV